MTNLRPQPNAIAVCSLGHVGIIESAHPQEVQYPDGTTGFAWVGRHILPPERFGTLWSSRHPRVLYVIPDTAPEASSEKEDTQ